MKTLYKKLLLLVFIIPASVFSQTGVDGVVTDSKSKQPIPGVNIVVQGEKVSTSTDFDGKFKLPKLKKGVKIVFSFIGYKNETVDYNNQKNINVVMVEDSNELKEVVVQVGYGSVKKKDATGSVDVILTKDFNKGPITSVDGLLNGRTAGVTIISSGTPGNDAVIRIRGGSSLAASNDPLIVVDGMPLDGNSLSSINPNDIESFSILKDASATAIYGNRGSNGVIIITTKKGSKKDMEVSLNTFTTYNTLAKKIDVYSAAEYRNLINTNAPTKASMLGTSNTDWQKEIFKPTFTSDLSLSVTGNLFHKIPSRLTLGNSDNNGLLLTSNFKRTTVSTAFNPSFFQDHLKFDITANYSYTFKRDADEGAIGSAIAYDPTQSVYNPNSTYAGYTEWTNSQNLPIGVSNPVSMLLEKYNVYNSQRIFGNIATEYKFHFLPEMKAIINAGIDNQFGDGIQTSNPISRSGLQNLTINGTSTNLPIGYYQTTWYHNTNKNISYQLNYSKKLGKLNVDGIAGYNYQELQRQSYYSGNLNAYYLGGLYAPEKASDVYTYPGNKLGAYFGRLNLGYNDKYLFTFNIRRDGSSKVSPQNKWKNFAGYAFAWKIKQENFLKDSQTISELKLRIGYGETGQQDIAVPFDWFKLYSTSNNNYYQFGNQYVIISKPEGYNENLKWETSKKYNVGLDFGFFNNRLKGYVDIYKTKTYDLFSQVAEGALQNLRIYGYRNIGNLETKGVDVNLNYNVIKKDNLDVSFNYNFTYNKVTISDLFSDNLLVGGIGLQQFTQIQKIGLAPNSFWVYQQVYDANGKPIEGVFVDRNGDGKIDSNDKYNYKKPTADYIMGFMINATFYKNWDISMAWKASIGNYIYDQVSANNSGLDAINNTQSGTLNNSPVSFGDSNFARINSSKESDYYIKDGSFLKLNDVTIGYEFNEMFGKKTKLRLYTSVKNVLTITKYKGIDPEVFNNGIDGGIFPRARMYALGAKVNF